MHSAGYVFQKFDFLIEVGISKALKEANLSLSLSLSLSLLVSFKCLLFYPNKKIQHWVVCVQFFDEN